MAAPLSSSCENISASASELLSTRVVEEAEAAFASLRESSNLHMSECFTEKQHSQNTLDAPNRSSSPSHSMNGDGLSVCWICRDGMSTPENPLVTNVCTCRGSIGWVHVECINEWVFSQRRTSCPNCDATYNIVVNSKVQLPQTFLNEVKTVFCNFMLPFVLKVVALLFGVAINGFAVPFAIGMSFYHADIFNISDLGWYTNTTDNAASVSTAGFITTPRPLSTGWTKNTSSHDNSTDLHSGTEDLILSGCWLWAGVMVYGWICVVLWRGVSMGWQQWLSIFSDEESEAGAEAAPYTMVEYVHWFMDCCLDRMGCSHKRVIPRIRELAILMPFSFLLSFPTGVVMAMGILGLLMVLWRLRFPRKKINDSKRRFEEVLERKDSATDLDILLWFITYVCEMLLFSVVMSVCGGIVLHFAVSPYFIAFPSSFEDFASDLTVLRLVLYWLLGALCSMMLMRVEAKVIFSLFAPGVDLFFVRSVSLDLDAESAYWNFILVQVFDADPLRILVDFVRVSVVELVALFLFLRIPICIAFTAYRTFSPQNVNEATLPLPLPTGFPVPAFEFNLNESSMFVFSNMRYQQQQHVWETNSSLSQALYFMGFGFTLFFRRPLGIFFWLLRHSSWIRWVLNCLIVIGTGVILFCFKLFPITQTHLRALRPVTVWIGRYIFQMEGFLFDAERLSILDRWLCGDGQGDIPVPDPPVAMTFMRRERTLPSDFVLPKCLKLRVALFSVIFFFLGTSLVWVGPVVAFTLLLSLVPYSIPLVCGAFNLFFFVLNHKLYLAAVTQFMMLSTALILGFLLQPVLLCAPLLDVSWRQLVRESVEYYGGVKRTVGEYKGESNSVDN